VPVYKRGKRGIWTVEFMIRGQRVKRALPEARTKAQAQQVETQLRQEVFDGKYGRAAGTHDFAEFVQKVYLPWAKAEKRSWKHDEFRGRTLCRYFAGKQFRDITPMLVEKFKRDRLNTTTVRHTQRSPASVNRELQLLSKIFTMALDNGLVESNPVSRVRKLREGGRRERYLTYEEEERLMNALTGRRAHVRPVVVIALNTGMRRGEILAMRWEHVNFGALAVFLSVRGKEIEIKPNHLLVPDSKSGKPRLIPMNNEVRGELLRLKQDAGGDGFVFTSARTGVNLTEVKRAFKSACREAGIENLRFHDLRHTVATRLKTRVDAFTLRDLLGHATIRMTGDYTHATPEDLQEAVSLLDGRPGEVIELERRRKA